MVHLQDAGFTVETEEVSDADLSAIKLANGVTPELSACHTAIVDGYVVEGHVPAAAIARLLAERPDVKGVTVPGMPMGSPGMEGSRTDPYDVLTFDEQGSTTVYESH